MKKLVLILSVYAIGLTFSYGQTIGFFLQHGDGEDLSGTTIETSVGPTTEYHFDVVNLSGGDLVDLSLQRVKIDEAEGVEDYLCWGANPLDGLCYPVSTVSPHIIFTTGDGAKATLPASDTAWMVTYYLPYDKVGCTHYRYHVLDDRGAKIDSIDLKFCGYLNVEDEGDVTMNIFPNPANSFVTVDINNPSNTISTFKLFNVIGEEVLEQTIVNGQNKVDVSNFSNGIYFYSILNNNDIIETKKLVIKH
ncbi:T9SS type A sorting domain-containing protein [Crocinitomix catalasitica]|uniref:T9SS type A sorting domain-containing protein n=1 Tax=Crocinitomix catalasitica TaxID=184607 RepID=UPI00146FC408|nr:T9SS type A sorting domain-containing protein [Crocinitomix catalasitica]